MYCTAWHAQWSRYHGGGVVGDFSLIFGSPESWILNPKWWAMLVSTLYQNSLVAIVVDKAHVAYILHFYIFMHLADAFIQSDLHCIQVTVSTFDQLLLSLGFEPMILALLTPCSTSWATGKHTNGEFAYTGLVINFNKLIYFDISSVQGGWAGALHTS